MSSSSSKLFIYLRWLCLLVILYVNTSSCQGSQKLCGKALPDTLDLICTNGFGTKTKKSIDPLDYYTDIEDDIPSLFEQSPFISKFASNALAKSRRRRHGIYDECCRKPCTLSELRSYCL